MTEQQQLHIGMINSFNIISGKCSAFEVMSSGVGFFAHIPDEDPDFETVNNMLDYFAEIDMFEKCLEIVEYMEENFNEDGTDKVVVCECERPEIESYSKKVFCANCNNRIRR
jgi:hypothetical protein